MADGVVRLTGASEAHRAYESFGGWSVWRHLAALFLVAGFVFIRFSSYVFATEVLFDERVFVAAFEQVAAGSSPYLAEPFNYPAPFALWGAMLAEGWGLFPVLVLLRSLSVVGLSVTVWWAAAFLPCAWWSRVALAVAFVLIAPPVAFAVRLGNLQFLVTGLLLSALLLWPRLPLASSLMLALSCLVKPIGVIAGVILFFHRPSASTRRHLVVAGLAGSMVLLAVVLAPHLGDFWQVAREPDHVALTLSPHRIFHSFGIRVDPRWVAVVVLVLCVIWARLRARPAWSLMPIAVVASLAATPVLWSHSLILALPVAAMACATAMSRCRPGAEQSARWELPLVALAVVLLQLSETLTRIGDLNPFAQLVLALPVIVTPLALAIYLDRVAFAADQSAGGSVMMTEE